MKKMVTAATTIIVVGFFAASAYAWGCGYGAGSGKQRGNGMQANGQPGVSQEERDAFFKDTQALRMSLNADQAELNALMAGQNPDPKRARALSESISKTRNEMRAKARQHNISGPMGGQGFCPGAKAGAGSGGGRHRNKSAGCW